MGQSRHLRIYFPLTAYMNKKNGDNQLMKQLGLDDSMVMCERILHLEHKVVELTFRVSEPYFKFILKLFWTLWPEFNREALDFCALHSPFLKHMSLLSEKDFGHLKRDAH